MKGLKSKNTEQNAITFSNTYRGGGGAGVGGGGVGGGGGGGGELRRRDAFHITV
jgi:hypothetical protein